MTGPADRERVAVALLDAWPAASQAVVIGGYAVSAYGPPRYSVDLDLVAPTAEREMLSAWMRGRSMALKKRWASRARGSIAATERWVRPPLAVDLLYGAVRDREAAVDLPAECVMGDPRPVRLVLSAASTTRPVRVARPEALWALKLQAGRPQDLTDLFAMSDVPADLEQVRDLFRGLWCPGLERKLSAVLTSVRDEGTYRDACSRRGLGSPSAPGNRSRWERFARRIDSAIPRRG